MIVADSDVLIDALRGREPSKSRIALELEGGALTTTAINAFELLSGARTSSQREKVGRLLAALQILPFDEEAGRRASGVRAELEQRGKGLAMADYMIAGVCLARSALLLTRNRAHFERVPGLALGRL
ncbi:MAG: type II toxin-antitoxin system VapC family toxin [Nitrospirae bacterium]|nr:type II toxin-antitoxin system VapC family toxin [Nitrospirota bacterium]